MKTALFVARLQPLHKGHAYAIRKLLGKYKVIVGIGSSNVSNEDNPFSFQQRKRMVKAVFGSATKVIPLKDFGDDKKWTRHAESRAKFDVVVTGNPWVRRCFRNHGTRKYEVLKPKLLKPRTYDASAIRKRMRSGRKWEDLVPAEIAAMTRKWFHDAER